MILDNKYKNNQPVNLEDIILYVSLSLSLSSLPFITHSYHFIAFLHHHQYHSLLLSTATASKLQATSPCHQEVDFIWHATLPPLTASPILVDLEGYFFPYSPVSCEFTLAASDGRKEVLAATSLHYIEILQGKDGAKTTGSPSLSLFASSLS